DAAEYGCGHNLKLEVQPGRVLRGADTGGKDDAGDGRQQRADDEANELDAAHVVTRQAGYLGVATNGIDLPAKRAVVHDIAKDNQENDGNDGRIGQDVEQATIGKGNEAVECRIIGDGPLSRIKID